MRGGREWSTMLAGLILVGGIYSVSFFLPALAIPLQDQPAMSRLNAEVAGRVGGEVLAVEGPSSLVIHGYQAFCNGFSGGWKPIAAWCANPVLWVGTVLLTARRWRAAAFAGCAALALGLTMILAIALDYSTVDVRWSVADYRSGYWLWLGSMAVLVLAAVIGRRISQLAALPACGGWNANGYEHPPSDPAPHRQSTRSAPDHRDAHGGLTP